MIQKSFLFIYSKKLKIKDSESKVIKKPLLFYLKHLIVYQNYGAMEQV